MDGYFTHYREQKFVLSYAKGFSFVPLALCLGFAPGPHWRRTILKNLKF